MSDPFAILDEFEIGPNGSFEVVEQLVESTPPDRPSRLLSRAEIAALPPLEPLVDGFLYGETLARLVGAPGSYKSFLAMAWACSIAVGTPWHGHAVKGGAVVYLVGEGSRGVDARLSAWETHYNGGRKVDRLHFYPEAINMAVPHADETLRELVIEMVAVDPALIVVDTQARYTPGAEENSARDMGLFVSVLDQVQRFTDACVLTIHHTARGSEHGRGSTAVEGAMQTELMLTKKRGEVVLSTIKQKDSEGQSITLTPRIVGASMVLDVPGAQADPFTVAMPRVHSGSPIHERLAAVLHRTFGHGASGGTKAEIKAAMQGDDQLRIEGDSRNVSRRFSYAWARLEELDAIEQVDGQQRFMLGDAYARDLELDHDGAVG